ncbi:hypothetical protein JKP88DRAFT_277811 [Tribonema minus]|uniref:SAP domain-containing protein n=1 Tax=Tribonema minus TaxID=303371 RepID=A0A835Z431_9STRA|nr:hypothetical protein JKP88DRAFT_277811 [Tribonema minus]
MSKPSATAMKNALSAAELRDLCEDNGLAVSGSKDEQVSRLRDCWADLWPAGLKVASKKRVLKAIDENEREGSNPTRVQFYFE